MKPDGTPTVEEVCAMMEQLQSWERAEVALKCCELRDLLADVEPDMIEIATGYYVYEDDPTDEMDLEDIDDWDLIEELKDRGYTVER